MNYLKKAALFIATLPIKFYQIAISPWLPSACIYNPSCSHYAIQAMHTHGIVKGFILGIARIFRCINLLFIGGEDPVPDTFSCREIKKGYQLHLKKRNNHD